MSSSYPPPVDQLLTLGPPLPSSGGPRVVPDYLALGLGEEHVPHLLRILADPALAWDLWEEGEDETPFWGPMHAWRALGQLRAAEAAGPLVELMIRDSENDWTSSEIPGILADLGPASLGPVLQALPRAVALPEPWTAGTLAEAAEIIAERHPDTRGAAVEALTGHLRGWEGQDPSLNAFLISSLIGLRGVEAAPLMEAAFAAHRVDESVYGDWEDVQVSLGLLEARVTPRWQPSFIDPEPWRPSGGGYSPPASAKAKQKAKSRRKAEKASRKRNRKRK